jgi:hypothetical protein
MILFIDKEPTKMYEETNLIIVLVTSSLLLLSEILGLSSCDANSIIELYKLLPGFGCIRKPQVEAS